jgi:hypothetical protein
LVTDLLFSLFIICIKYKSTDDGLNLAFIENYKINIYKLSEIINLIPSILNMKNTILENKFNDLNKLNYLIIPLLKWIITCNMTYLKVCESISIENIILPQTIKKIFIMKNTTLEKERIFDIKKKQYGVRYLYSSPCYNWHLILNNGLKNYSNTKYMTCGAIYGSGIYLSDNIQVSLNYSYQHGLWVNSMYNNISLIVLCEVANVPELVLKQANIFTLIDEYALITRYLLSI